METKVNKTEKKLYLIAYEPDTRMVTYARELPRSAGPQTKYYADTFLRKLDPEFRAEHHFAVVVSPDEVKPGETAGTGKMEVCFNLI